MKIDLPVPNSLATSPKHLRLNIHLIYITLSSLIFLGKLNLILKTVILTIKRSAGAWPHRKNYESVYPPPYIFLPYHFSRERPVYFLHSLYA